MPNKMQRLVIIAERGLAALRTANESPECAGNKRAIVELADSLVMPDRGFPANSDADKMLKAALGLQ